MIRVNVDDVSCVENKPYRLDPTIFNIIFANIFEVTCCAILPKFQCRSATEVTTPNLSQFFVSIYASWQISYYHKKKTEIQISAPESITRVSNSTVSIISTPVTGWKTSPGPLHLHALL